MWRMHSKKITVTALVLLSACIPGMHATAIDNEESTDYASVEVVEPTAAPGFAGVSDFGPAEAPGPAADFGQYDEYYFADSPTNEYDFAEGPFGFDYAPGPFGEYEEFEPTAAPILTGQLPSDFLPSPPGTPPVPDTPPGTVPAAPRSFVPDPLFSEAPGPASLPEEEECGELGQECCVGPVSCDSPDLECNMSPFFTNTQCVLCGLKDTPCCFGEDDEFSCKSSDLVCDFSDQDLGAMCKGEDRSFPAPKSRVRRARPDRLRKEHKDRRD